MRNYFKYIVYFGLSVVDSAVNLLFSFLHLYPSLDLSGNFLVNCEISRLEKWNYKRQQGKIDKQMQALTKIEEAKSHVEN